MVMMMMMVVMMMTTMMMMMMMMTMLLLLLLLLLMMMMMMVVVVVMMMANANNNTKNRESPWRQTTKSSASAATTSRSHHVSLCCFRWMYFNTLRPRQDGRHFPDDILKCIFLNENVWILLTISLKCVRKVRINNIPSLVQIMAWRRPGDKPLSEPMMVSLLTHICVTRPQWVNECYAIMIILCWLFDTYQENGRDRHGKPCILSN